MTLTSAIQPDDHDHVDRESKAAKSHHATLDAVAQALSRLRYGAVQLTVHDGKVVQLDVTERQRFT